MSAAQAAERAPVITNQQGRELLGMMGLFYSNPKNQAAYEAWLAERTARGLNPGKTNKQTKNQKEDETA